MSDIWSGVGADLNKNEGEWLYRVGAEVRGPVAQRLIVEKLISGEINLDTPVAREGTDFSPIGQVRAFEQHIRAAKKARAKRASQKVRRTLLIICVPVLLIVGGVSYQLQQDYKKRLKLEHERVLATAAKVQAAAQAQVEASHPEHLPKMGLVALVSLGTQDDVKIRGNPAPAVPGAVPATKGKKKMLGKRLGRVHEGPEEPEQDEELVQTCKLSQQDIFGTLRNHLAKLNVCVEDEKKRDTENLLPPTLELQFVVKPTGKVVDFIVNDRHYRAGPLNNCMIKAFNTIAFPPSAGANCPITIPIKIGK